jgi:hypothetical protein
MLADPEAARANRHDDEEPLHWLQLSGAFS